MLASSTSPTAIIRAGLLFLISSIAVVLFFTAESNRHGQDLNQQKINQLSSMVVANNIVNQDSKEAYEHVSTLAYSDINFQLKSRLSIVNKEKLQRVIAAEKVIFSNMPIELNAQKEWMSAVQMEAFIQTIETQESITSAGAPMIVMTNPLFITGFLIIGSALLVIGFGLGRMRASALVFSIRDLTYKDESKHLIRTKD